MPGKSKRGFAAMSPEKQRAIASKGGERPTVKALRMNFPQRRLVQRAA